jgi:hypothetical protein
VTLASARSAAAIALAPSRADPVAARATSSSTLRRAALTSPASPRRTRVRTCQTRANATISASP